MTRIRLLGAAAMLTLLVLPGSAAASLPSGFVNTTVSGGLTRPTQMALAPDGRRIFVSEQDGQLRVIKNGTLLAAPFASLSVDSSGERGLLGVAFDPAFATNHHVYVYYTAAAPTVHNRVSRLTASGDVAAPGSEKVLFDLPTATATNHMGGGLHFGTDGKLYVAVGDHSSSSNAQTLANPFGKMLRITKLGGIPSDNPFYGTASGKNRAIWALGLRNPFTFAVQRGTGRIFVNDVGASTWEEIDDGKAGENYAWPVYEGPSSDPAYEPPLFAYGHGAGETTGSAITGGDFYNPAFAQFGSGYVGSYFFADLSSGWIRRLAPSSYSSASSFATADTAQQPVDVRIGLDGSLYYLERGGASGSVHRITRGLPPAVTGFTPASGAAGTTPVTINGSRLGGTTRVRFGERQAKLVSVSATSVRAIVPYGAVTGPIRAETPSGWAVSPTDFQVTFTISRFSPATGPPGTLVTIDGAGFTNPSTVKFDGTAAPTTYVSPTRLRAVVPAGATTGKIAVVRSGSPSTTLSASNFVVSS